VTQTNAIVIRIRKDQAAEFERLFEAEELTVWDDLAARGVLLRASLTRVGFGSEESEDYRCYLIIAEFPSMAGHSAHDDDPRFKAFLKKARAFQPEGPSVWGGRTLWSRPLEAAAARARSRGSAPPGGRSHGSAGSEPKRGAKTGSAAPRTRKR
jgi:hypothetical protein